jgi:hypothetical protein
LGWQTCVRKYTEPSPDVVAEIGLNPERLTCSLKTKQAQDQKKAVIPAKAGIHLDLVRWCPDPRANGFPLSRE